MAKFQEAFLITMGHEGRYSNNPDDKGGETMWGITIAVARAYGYYDAMKDLPIEVAQAIYKKEYWDRLRLDDVDSQLIANELFDTGVNAGTGTAGIMLQRTLNVLNRYGKDWQDLWVDGNVGPLTIKTLNKAIETGREKNILKGLNILQGYHYFTCAENPTRRDENFINGWFANRIGK